VKSVTKWKVFAPETVTFNSEEPIRGAMTSETDALEHIHTWREHLSDQTLVSASEVQNRLFDLYGDLEPLPQLDKLKPWLSLTIQRELFTAAEVDAFLDELAEELGAAAQ
jgi:hypothetical protein